MQGESVLRDVDVSRGEVLVFQVPWLPEGEAYLVSRRNAPPLCFSPKRWRRNLRAACDDVEYVAHIGPYVGARAIVPLCQNLEYSALTGGTADSPSYGLLAFQMVKDRKLRQGEKRTYEYLAVWSEVGAGHNTFIDEVMEKMGLRGRTAYTVTIASCAFASAALRLSTWLSGAAIAGMASNSAVNAAVLAMCRIRFMGVTPRRVPGCVRPAAQWCGR